VYIALSPVDAQTMLRFKALAGGAPDVAPPARRFEADCIALALANTICMLSPQPSSQAAG